MRVVLLHQSPDADPAASDFARAAEEFNRGLDIRLRFLDVGFTIRPLPVRDGDDLVAMEFSETAGAFRPGAVVALGRGPRLLECVSAAAKAGLFLLYLVPGPVDRTAAAIARLADLAVLAGPGDPGLAGLSTIALDGRAPGPALVDLIVRSVKERQHP